MIRGLPGVLLVVVLSASGCSHASRDLAPAHASLGGHVVARVGSIDIPASLVAAVASSQRVAPTFALSRLVEDALAADGAVAHSLDRSPEVMFTKTTALGRATLRRLDAEAHSTPPSDDEVRRMSLEHWLVVDAPATATTMHAVVLRPAPPNPALEASAQGVAAAIAAAVASAPSPAEFEAVAKAVPHPKGLEVSVETLPPLTPDGRAAVPGAEGQFDPKFALAATSLSTPGATSGVVETSFGWHVIRLLEKSAPRFVPFEERRTLFAAEIYARRAHDALDALETERRTRMGVTLANGIDEVLSFAFNAPSAPGP